MRSGFLNSIATFSGNNGNDSNFAQNVIDSYNVGYNQTSNYLIPLITGQLQQKKIAALADEALNKNNRSALAEISAYSPQAANTISDIFDRRTAESAKLAATFKALDVKYKEKQYTVLMDKLRQLNYEHYDGLPASYSPEAEPFIDYIVNSGRDIENVLQDDERKQKFSQELKKGAADINLVRSRIATESAKQQDIRRNTQLTAAKMANENLKLAQANESIQTANNLGLTPLAYQESQKIYGKSRGEDMSSLNSLSSKLPVLLYQVNKLGELGKKATYTITGKVYDLALKELLGKTSEGAAARSEYNATIDNIIIPLLKDTFGSQFTADEGRWLKGTLGRDDDTPEQKQAILNSFISSKVDTIKGLASSFGQKADITIPSEGTFSISENKILKKGDIYKNPQTGERKKYLGAGKWENL